MDYRNSYLGRKCTTPETLTDGHTRIANAGFRFQNALGP